MEGAGAATGVAGVLGATDAGALSTCFGDTLATC